VKGESERAYLRPGDSISKEKEGRQGRLRSKLIGKHQRPGTNKAQAGNLGEGIRGKARKGGDSPPNSIRQ